MDFESRKIKRAPFKAFTLVELLVVISIISLLLSILVPSLNKAKKISHRVKCGSNMKNVGIAILAYTSENDQFFPASYLYPYDDKGNYNIRNQDASHPYGYLHWSWYLFYSGKCSPEVFTCPSMPRGGAPRTNPGSNPEDWEQEQLDQNGQRLPNGLTDKQAPRIAITANAAIIPRNKFTTIMSGGQRVNRFVRTTEILSPSTVILATEFNSNWKAIGVRMGSGILSKSHRPICAFSHIGSGYIGNGLYIAPINTPGYVYGDPFSSQGTYGLRPLKEIETASDLLDGGCGHPINAIGRHHPGPGQSTEYGGCANFLYCDGRVQTKTVLETLKNREWGEKFYSITGKNDILR